MKSRKNNELPLDKYGVFLFTSAFEGLPNVLLEAGAQGIPIVASEVGGVSELINQQTGWPVLPDANEVENIALSLDQALENTSEAKLRREMMYKILRERHSHKVFWRTAKASSSFFR